MRGAKVYLCLLMALVLASTQTAEENEYNCKTFSADKKSCTECNIGFFKGLTEAKQFGCFRCPIGCQECNSIYCFKCAEGFYSHNSVCYECSESQRGCAKCQSLSECSLCQEGYELVQGKCTFIGKKQCAVNDCLDCVAEGDSCVQCAVGFHKLFNIVKETYSCEKCIENCATCYNKFQCAQCSEGLQLTEKGLCEEVILKIDHYFKLKDADFYRIMAIIFIAFFSVVLLFFLLLVYKKKRSRQNLSEKYVLLEESKKTVGIEDEETKDNL